MNTLALQRDAFMPRPPGGTGPGLLLAIVVHIALVIALAFGVHWHASEPEGVSAELWAAVPQVAAPRVVEPEPTPTPTPPPPRPAPVPKPEATPDAQIAIERAKRVEQERKKKEQAEELAKKRQHDLDEQRKKQLEDARLAALHDAEVKRILKQAGAGDRTSQGEAPKDAGPSAGYAGRIKARIKPNIVFTETITGNPVAEVEVSLAPDGRILGRKLLKGGSGMKEWDEAVQRAIDRTEVLPRDIDGRVPSTMIISFRPRD